jgi:gamma-glutamylcysteine synthetase
MNSDDMTALAENASTVARAIRISREARAGDAFAPRPDLEAEAQALFAEFDGAKPAGAATRRRSAWDGTDGGKCGGWPRPPLGLTHGLQRSRAPLRKAIQAR